MVKYLFLILCFFGLTVPAHSQALLAILFGSKIHNDKLSLGAYLGPQFSMLTNTPGSDYKTSLAIGAYTNIKMSDKWTLSNYFIFKSPRGGESIPLAYQLVPNVPGAAQANIKRKITYMEISPLMRYNITAGLSVAAGPQVAFRTLAKDIYRIDLPDGGYEEITYKVRKLYRLMDVDLAADLQYAFKKGEGMRINFRYSHGLTNVYATETHLQAKVQYFQLGVGIPIAIGK